MNASQTYSLPYGPLQGEQWIKEMPKIKEGFWEKKDPYIQESLFKDELERVGKYCLFVDSDDLGIWFYRNGKRLRNLSFFHDFSAPLFGSFSFVLDYFLVL